MGAEHSVDRQISGRVRSIYQIPIASSDGCVALVEFSPTSSPELDAILSKYREKLFVPSVLSEDHRRLIYRPSKHGQLLNDPGVTVTLPNDEDLKLKPMRLEERPIKRKAILHIKDILSSTQDDDAWNNLIPFLEGMRTAKEPISTKFLCQIARKACEQGKFSIPQRCAELAKRTDFRLCYPGLATTVFIGCHDRAAAAGFKGDELLAAAKQAEYFALILEREEHCGGKLKEDEIDARKNLTVLGVLLELAAAKAVHVDAGKDQDSRVASYVAKVLALFDDRELKPWDFSDSEAQTLREKELKNYSLHRTGKYLVRRIPLWHGMKLASKVNGAIQPEVAKEFNERLRSLETNVRKAEAECREAVQHQPKKALIMFDQLQLLQR